MAAGPLGGSARHDVIGRTSLRSGRGTSSAVPAFGSEINTVN